MPKKSMITLHSLADTRNMAVKPIIGRLGGKARLAPWVIEHLTRFQWSIYCEPFAGSAAVYFRMVQEGIFEQIRARGHHPRIVLNDADSRIVQLFKTCRDHPELLAYAVAMTPYSREEHRLAQQGIDGIEDEIEQARRYLTQNWQDGGARGRTNSMGIGNAVWCLQETESQKEVWQTLPQRILAASPHLQGDPSPVDSRHILNEAGRAFVQPPVDVRVEMARRYLVGNWQSTVDDGTGWSRETGQNEKKSPDRLLAGSKLGRWQTLPQRILNATDAFKRCYIENGDAVKCIERWATPHTCIYADPPYVNCEAYYAHNAKAGKDSNLEMHHRLAEALNTVEAACVAVSYYPNELLDELYPESHWERHYKDTVASSAGITRNSKTKTRPKRTELLLVRKAQGEAPKVNLSGQLGLF